MHTMKSVSAITGFLAVSLLLFSGCDSGDRLAVSGVVTLDGQPLSAGTITFVPADGNKTSSSGGFIEDGQFLFLAENGLLPGEYHIFLVPMLRTGRQVANSLTGQMYDEQFPVNYKEVGKLEAIVVAGEDNAFDFSITRIK